MVIYHAVNLIHGTLDTADDTAIVYGSGKPTLLSTNAAGLVC